MSQPPFRWTVMVPTQERRSGRGRGLADRWRGGERRAWTVCGRITGHCQLTKVACAALARSRDVRSRRTPLRIVMIAKTFGMT